MTQVAPYCSRFTALILALAVAVSVPAAAAGHALMSYEGVRCMACKRCYPASTGRWVIVAFEGWVVACGVCRSFSDDVVLGYIDHRGGVQLNPSDSCTPGPGSKLVLLTEGSECGSGSHGRHVNTARQGMGQVHQSTERLVGPALGAASGQASLAAQFGHYADFCRVLLLRAQLDACLLRATAWNSSTPAGSALSTQRLQQHSASGGGVATSTRWVGMEFPAALV